MTKTTKLEHLQTTTAKASVSVKFQTTTIFLKAAYGRPLHSPLVPHLYNMYTFTLPCLQGELHLTTPAPSKNTDSCAETAKPSDSALKKKKSLTRTREF